MMLDNNNVRQHFKKAIRGFELGTVELNQVAQHFFHLFASSHLLATDVVDFAKLLSLVPWLRFEIGAAFKEDLDRGEASQRLRGAFRRERINLSNHPRVSIEQENRHWRIIDRGNTYVIRSIGNELRVYQTFRVKHEQLRSVVRLFDKLPLITNPRERKARLQFDLAMRLSENANLPREQYSDFRRLVQVLRGVLNVLKVNNRYLQREHYYQELVRAIIAYAKS